MAIIFACLTINPLGSQTFFSSKDLSFNINYGFGKIGYYHIYTITYIGASDNKAVGYSPSYSFKLEKGFWLNNRFDFYLGIGHLTITEKSKQTAKPSWISFGSKELSQSFIHIMPTIKVKLHDERFTINLGLRMGTASFFGGSPARSTSNSLGRLYADFDSECGASIRIMNKLFMEIAWIHGLTKYNYTISTPVPNVSFFKYHSFQFGLRYIIKNGRKEN